MELDARTRAFLDKNHSEGMVTLRSDGMPHVVRIGVALLDGKLWSSGTQHWQRTKHVRRDPRATLFVFESPGYVYLSIESRVTILEGPDVPESSLRLFWTMQNRQPGDTVMWYGGELTPDQFRTAMIEEQRLIFEFEPLRVYPRQSV